jgi:hypothetical protein
LILSAAIGIPEEIKRAHWNKQWSALPDRYAALRKSLISLKKTSTLCEEHASVVQAAIANLSDMEKAVEKALPDVPNDAHLKFNALLSENIDELQGVLAELKFTESGA